ncbi:hypothetical protein BX070DRAFT_83599 [Coemansia spiralis]|nr:hypothetical protein BX070DRAFT_83599 [Coemansia spiralis]
MVAVGIVGSFYLYSHLLWLLFFWLLLLVLDRFLGVSAAELSVSSEFLCDESFFLLPCDEVIVLYDLNCEGGGITEYVVMQL